MAEPQTTDSGNSGGVLQRTLQQRDQILQGASKSDFPAELSPCTEASRPDHVSQPASSGRATVFPITTLTGGCYTHSPNTRAEQQHRCDGSVHALVADSSTPVVTISDSGTGHNVPVQSNCDNYLCQREDSRAHRPVHLAHQGASVVDSIPERAVIPSWTTLSQIGTDERRTDSDAMPQLTLRAPLNTERCTSIPRPPRAPAREDPPPFQAHNGCNATQVPGMGKTGEGGSKRPGGLDLRPCDINRDSSGGLSSITRHDVDKMPAHRWQTWRCMFEPSKHHTGHMDPWRHMSSLSDSSNWPAHAPAVDEVRLDELVTDANIALAGNKELLADLKLAAALFSDPSLHIAVPQITGVAPAKDTHQWHQRHSAHCKAEQVRCFI